MSGVFITLEGGEGVGKSTQSRMLAEALRQRGIKVIETREPGGTPGAEAIRELLLSNTSSWLSRAEALLFAAARSDHTIQVIQPALARGDWVICDRYVDSSRAYQGGQGEGLLNDFGITDAEIMQLHNIGTAGAMPDVTLLLEVTPQVAAARLAARDGNESDRIGGRDENYHAHVRAAFRRMAAAEPDRFRTINADGPPELVHARVVEAVRPWLGLVR